MIIQTTDEILTFLKNDKHFAQFEDSTLRAIATCSVVGSFKQNQFLWNFGEQCDHCTLILSGLIEITRPTGTEEDTCMGIFGTGDTIGLFAFLNKVTFPGSAKALNPSKTLKMYLGTLNEGPNKNSILNEMNHWLKERILAHEHILREKIDIISAGTIENRLRELFKYLLRRFGSIQSGCKYEINIKLAKSKAAKLMGIRNETAIRLINDWQKRNLIQWEEDKIIVTDLDIIDRYIMQKRSK